MNLQHKTQFPSVGRFLTMAAVLFFALSSLPAQLIGTYTIGGFSPNYPTIRAAVSHLYEQGIAGPVIFQIRPGIYEEQITLRRVKGSSSYRTITFQSESGIANQVTIHYSPDTYGQDYVLRMDNAYYYRIKNLTLKTTGYGAARVVMVTGQAYDLRIEGCRLLAPSLVSAVEEQSVVYVAPSVGRDILITNNYIRGGAYGIHFSGLGSTGIPGTRIIGNNLGGYYATGVDITHLNGGEFTGNRIFGGSYNPDITKCLAIRNWNGTLSNPVLIANNFIAIPTGNQWAVTIHDSENLQFYYNSLSQNNDKTLFVLSGVRGIAVKNNILRAGTGLAVFVERTTGLSMDYNDLLTDGRAFGTFNGSSAYNLTQWKFLFHQDQHSVSVDPQFVSAYDLHAKAIGLMGRGVSVPGVTRDIDGESRSVSPCIGADEFKFKWPYDFGRPYPLPFGFMSKDGQDTPQEADATSMWAERFNGEEEITPVLNPSVTLGSQRDGVTDDRQRLKESKLAIFPNPVADKLNLTVYNDYVGEVILTVLDHLGRKMYSTSFKKVDNQMRTDLAVDHLPPGVYQLHMRAGSRDTVERFIKQ
ncbi:MAG: T9SS type A sorting domain-containing protein [Lewinella sp.]